MAESKDDEKNKQEEEIKSFCQNEAVKHGSKVSKFLRDVALDDSYRDKKAIKVKIIDEGGESHYEYQEVQVPVSINVRVTAAKTWKEMVMDKAVGDVKEKAKTTRSEGLDMKKAMEAIAKAKAAEKSTPIEEEL